MALDPSAPFDPAHEEAVYERYALGEPRRRTPHPTLTRPKSGSSGAHGLGLVGGCAMKVPAILESKGADATPSITLSRHARRTEVLTVCEAIAKEIGDPPDLVTPQSRLAEDLGLDLFDVAEMVAALEARFSVQIPDGALHSFRTVADIQRFLGANLYQPGWSAGD